ncbi:hypothetical protein [Escherichia coli]|uniref:hypothetical protein n=1 Tax=Escherichia coli TaxID=562 RepID=UPI001FF1B795|nr:hypothetical protein [Escherichia coli]
MKLAFANEIVFVKTHPNQKTPEEVQARIIKQCEKHGLTFDGFVLPYVSGVEARFQVSYQPTGLSSIHALKQLNQINGGSLKRNEEGYKIQLTERGKQEGKQFLGWDGEYNHVKGTKAKFLCLKHNEEFTTPLNLAFRRNLNCSCCTAESNLARRNGCNTLTELRAKRESQIKELCKEFGYTFVCWLSEEKGVRETLLRCNCPYHGDWDLTTREPCDRGILICPDCLSNQRSLETGEYNLRRIDKTRPTYLYIQKLGDEFIKIGFASNSKKRMQQQAKLSTYKHELIFNHLFEKGWQAIDLEKGLKIHVKGKTASKHDVPDGWTETRPIKTLKKALNFINEYIAANPDRPMYLNEWEEKPDFVVTDEDLAKWMNAPLADLEPEDLELDLSHFEDA